MLEARAAIRNLPRYSPPLGGRDGLRFDFNENTIGCSPRVLRRLQQLTGEDLARYPERESTEATLARHFEISPQELLLTNGTDEAIHLLCETYLQPDDEALIVVPTFAMYEIYAAATGARVIAIPANGDFTFPTDRLLQQITPRTRLIAIANPNNPTGLAVPQNELLLIANAAPNAAILIDEAYFQFYGQTLIGHWRKFPNLFVARTFSKAYGLAGLRAGVLMGHPEHMAIVRRASSPYNVNQVALACLPDALADQDYISRYVAQVRQGRSFLQAELQSWGLVFWPSQANFVLVSLGTLLTDFVRCMRERGILVRDRSRDYECEGCVRITVGTLGQTEQLLGVLRDVLQQIGVQRIESQLKAL